MSWSINVIGKPDAIKRALARQSETLTGESKREFDEARPAIETLLDQNMSAEGACPYAICLDANGHGSSREGKKLYGACSVSIKTLGQMVE